MIRAAILVTGDEVLGGRVAERNAGHLARALAEVGARVERTLLVSDAPDEVEAGVRELAGRGVDLVVTTGGLGPTPDDLTMPAVAAAAGRAAAVDPQALEMVRAQSRNLPRRLALAEDDLERLRRKQATLPQGATVIPPAGTAPGAILEIGGTTVVVLPGPPWELQAMWRTAMILPPLAAVLARGDGPATTTLRLWGVYEAELVGVLEALDASDLAEIGTYTRDGELEVVAPHPLAGRIRDLLRAAFPAALFAEDGEHADDIVARLLTTRGETLAVGESCTGGGLGARLTALPGASAWFAGGVIAYANAVKTALLDVPQDLLASAGAVSGEVALAMASGAARRSGATWGVGITGIAGPEGGTTEKPVGLVYVGIAGPETAASHRHVFRGDRDGVRRRAQTAAVHHLRAVLAG